MVDFAPYTHLFSFNPTWSNEIIEAVIKIINKTASFKVLVWNKKLSECPSLKNVQLKGQISSKSVGNQTFTFYFYEK